MMMMMMMMMKTINNTGDHNKTRINEAKKKKKFGVFNDVDEKSIQLMTMLLRNEVNLELLFLFANRNLHFTEKKEKNERNKITAEKLTYKKDRHFRNK